MKNADKLMKFTYILEAYEYLIAYLKKLVNYTLYYTKSSL